MNKAELIKAVRASGLFEDYGDDVIERYLGMVTVSQMLRDMETGEVSVDVPTTTEADAHFAKCFAERKALIAAGRTHDDEDNHIDDYCHFDLEGYAEPCDEYGRLRGMGAANDQHAEGTGAANGENMTNEHNSTNCSCHFSEQLERKYTLVIEANKATASLGGKRVAVVTAILGTEFAEVQMDFGGPSVLGMRVNALQTFTDSNLAVELKKMCLFILAEWEIALTSNN